MKHRIQLTEQDIVRMVKRALNESDWKTHFNAYKTALDRDDPRADSFKDYSTELINKKYGLGNTKFGKNYVQNSNINFEYPDNIQTTYNVANYSDKKHNNDIEYNSFLYNDDDNEVNHTRYYDNNYEPTSKENKDYNYDDFDNYLNQEEDNIGDTTNDPQGEYYKNYIRANKDISGLVSGKTKYEKGKGWQNESLDRRVKKSLHESLRSLNKDYDVCNKYLISDNILDSSAIQQILSGEGYNKRDYDPYSEEVINIIKYYYEETYIGTQYHLEEMPKYSKFICLLNDKRYLLYYDYGADYYFLVSKNEEDIYELCYESLNRRVKKSIRESLKRMNEQYEDYDGFQDAPSYDEDDYVTYTVNGKDYTLSPRQADYVDQYMQGIEEEHRENYSEYSDDPEDWEMSKEDYDEYLQDILERIASNNY